MNHSAAQLNLVVAWIWILLGFASGAVLGLGFHRDDWLGGYSSFKRRMYRLGHISFFGLGLMNLMFYFTAQSVPLSGPATFWAANAFVVGAATMPPCCVLFAHCRKVHFLFAIPVTSLLLASGLTIWSIIRG